MNRIWYDTQGGGDRRHFPGATDKWFDISSYDDLKEAKRVLRRELDRPRTAFVRGRVVSHTPNVGADGLVYGCERKVECEMKAKGASE